MYKKARVMLDYSCSMCLVNAIANTTLMNIRVTYKPLIDIPGTYELLILVRVTFKTENYIRGTYKADDDREWYRLSFICTYIVGRWPWNQLLES